MDMEALIASNAALTAQIAELSARFPKPAPTTITRADFDKLGPAERHGLIKGGCAVSDPPARPHPDAPLRAAHQALALARAGQTDKAAAMIADRATAFAAMRHNAELALTFVPAEYVTGFDHAQK